MKTLNIALVAAALVTAAVPAVASEAPSYKEQMTNLWLSTGDASYAKLAGVTDRQLSAVRAQPHETVSLAPGYDHD